MANPDRQEATLSRRALFGDFRDKQFAIAVSASFLTIPVIAGTIDRIDLLTFEGQENAVIPSAITGAVAGGGVEFISRVVFPAGSKISRRETLKRYVKAASAGIIFAAATPPTIGGVGEIETYFVRPKLTGKTHAEILDKLQQEKIKNEQIRESYGH